ncbi:MAG TPA: hypothetical protein VIK72_04605, partial [Clostridiaceae bacterium]
MDNYDFCPYNDGDCIFQNSDQMRYISPATLSSYVGSNITCYIEGYGVVNAYVVSFNPYTGIANLAILTPYGNQYIQVPNTAISNILPYSGLAYPGGYYNGGYYDGGYHGDGNHGGGYHGGGKPGGGYPGGGYPGGGKTGGGKPGGGTPGG